MADRPLPLTVEIDSDALRAWAERHADAGHHGVAHALYQAANGVESITEQHDRETAARAWDEGANAAWESSGEGWNGEYPPGTEHGIPNPYREGGAS